MLSAVIVLCEVASENILIYNAVCTGKPYKWSINCVFLFNLDAFFEVQNSSSHIYTVLVYTMPHGIAIGCCSNLESWLLYHLFYCIVYVSNIMCFMYLYWTEQFKHIYTGIEYNYAYIAFRHTMHMHIYMFCFKILCNRKIFSVFSKLTL